MVKYVCKHCGLISKKSIGGWTVQCECGEFTEPYISGEKKLYQARLEARSKVTRLQRHLFQCESCNKIKIQTDWEKQIPCKCGGLMNIKYTYIGKNEYDASTGEPVQITNKQQQDNILKTTRKKRGVSQKELAEELKISQQLISAIEAGERTMPDIVKEWVYS